jgi:hypothetical protein
MYCGSLPCEWLRFIRELRYANRHKEVPPNNAEGSAVHRIIGSLKYGGLW